MNTGDIEERMKIQDIEPIPSQRIDPLLYRIIVGALAFTLIASAIGGLILAGMGIAVPDTIVALGAGSLGALGGTLVPKA